MTLFDPYDFMNSVQFPVRVSPMKVAVIGATGSTGALVVDKLLARGHAVVAIGRSPGHRASRPLPTL